MFGSLRNADVTADADQNLIIINDACPQYMQNAGSATIKISSLRNPGYVITSDSFYLEIRDANGNKVVKTSGGMVHTTTPGTIDVPEWYSENRLVSFPTELTFSLQPTNPTQSDIVQIKLGMPPEDFEVLPDPCAITYNNQLVNVNTWSCTTDTATNTFIIEAQLMDPYQYQQLADIEFAIDLIPMPSSSRPTGTFTLEFYDLIDGVYRLVDITSVENKF